MKQNFTRKEVSQIIEIVLSATGKGTKAYFLGLKKQIPKVVLEQFDKKEAEK